MENNEKPLNQDGGVIAEFDKCPVCGCKDRLLKKLAQESIDRGLVPENFRPQPIMIATSPIRDPLKPPIIGMRYPNAIILLDVCMNPECGMLYPVKILRGQVEPHDPLTIRMPKRGG